MTSDQIVIRRAASRNAIHFYLSSPINVLALWQPWATLFVAPDPLNNDEPPKSHESRHWYPRHLKPPFAVAIHAAKKFDSTTKDALSQPPFRDALKRCGFYPHDPRPFADRKVAIPGGQAPMVLGAIIGLATIDRIATAQPITMQQQLDGVVPLDLSTLSPDDRAFGFFEPNRLDTHHPQRFAWRAANVIMLPTPIRHQGRQDTLYPLDAWERDQIDQQLHELEAGL